MALERQSNAVADCVLTSGFVDSMPNFETTAEQRQQLLTDGFSLLSGALPPSLLTDWQGIAEQLEVDALEARARNEARHGACVIVDPAGPRLVRQDDILGEYTDAVLDLLACPAMMAIARDMCGRGAVPLQADILFKHQHPHPVINWHQGAPHPRTYPYLNVGIYLDDANANDGCLRYVPGTQDAIQDICEMSAADGWAIPGVVEQPAQAGDILVQDMMVLHGSPPKRSAGVRRTLYVELRPSLGIVESETQSAEWKRMRERWMGLVLRRADVADWPADWLNDVPKDLGSDKEEVAAIVSNWEPPIPAVYCPHEMPHDIQTDDYPVPSDLRE